jgi:coenzyme PQQ biosynthesis protein PqqD
MIPLEARPKLASKARLRFDRRTGRHLLLYPEKGLLLNPTGASILELCTGEHTLLRIVEELSAKYSGTPGDQMSTEVLTFVEAMVQKGLVEVLP